MENRLLIITTRKINNFFQQKEKPKNTKAACTDDSKTIGKKFGFTAAFADIIRKRALPKEFFIHTAKMSAIKVDLQK